MGADPERQFTRKIGEVIRQRGLGIGQFSGEFHHIAEGLLNGFRQIAELGRIVDWLVLDPTHHGGAIGRLSDHIEDSKALLAEGDDVAATVISGLVLEHFRAATDRGHGLADWIPAHHAETAIIFKHALQHHSVPRLEDVQRQNVPRKQHNIRQREEGQLSDGQISHAGCFQKKQS